MDKWFDIYNKQIKVGKDKYNFIIKERYISGWGTRFAKGRARPKTYEIQKNGECILITKLHQTFYKYQRNILGGN